MSIYNFKIFLTMLIFDFTEYALQQDIINMIVRIPTHIYQIILIFIWDTTIIM